MVFWSAKDGYFWNDCFLPSRSAYVPAKKLTRARLDTTCAPRAVALMVGNYSATNIGKLDCVMLSTSWDGRIYCAVDLLEEGSG